MRKSDAFDGFVSNDDKDPLRKETVADDPSIRVVDIVVKLIAIFFCPECKRGTQGHKLCALGRHAHNLLGHASQVRKDLDDPSVGPCQKGSEFVDIGRIGLILRMGRARSSGACLARSSSGRTHRYHEELCSVW